MKLLTLTFVLLASLAVVIDAVPKYMREQDYRSYGDEDDLDVQSVKKMKFMDSSNRDSASTGRLFMKKFFFKKMFGQNQNPPIIPIIITGVNPDDGTNIDTPTNTPTSTTTTTNTDTGPIPTGTATPATQPGTGTDTGTATAADPANPADPAGPAGPADPANPIRRIQLYGRGSNDEYDKEPVEESAAIDEQYLADDLPAGDEEFVVTDQEIKSTSTAKANRAPNRIKLRLRGGKRGQVVSVRIPANYRGYFKNGQRVVLNRNKINRPIKRRVTRRRRNRRRPNKNKNKRRRFLAA